MPKVSCFGGGGRGGGGSGGQQEPQVSSLYCLAVSHLTINQCRIPDKVAFPVDRCLSEKPFPNFVKNPRDTIKAFLRSSAPNKTNDPQTHVHSKKVRAQSFLPFFFFP